MKPLHIGLLVVGAALAGGLAVKMTQEPPIPAPPPNAALPVRAQPVRARPVSAPPVVSVRAVKPSPLPAIRAAAPERVDAPVNSEPEKSPIRKNKPISVASLKPTQWTPRRYEAPVKAKLPEPAPAAAPVAPSPVEANVTSAPLPAAAQAVPPTPHHQATLRTGLTIPIRVDESLSTDFSPIGGTFEGSLIEPLATDGFVIAEQGARVTGRIIDSQRAGRSAGMSRLELGLTNVTTSDGQSVAISTAPWMNLGDNVPAKTVIRFRVTLSVTITERQIADR